MLRAIKSEVIGWAGAGSSLTNMPAEAHCDFDALGIQPMVIDVTGGTKALLLAIDRDPKRIAFTWDPLWPTLRNGGQVFFKRQGSRLTIMDVNAGSIDMRAALFVITFFREEP